MPETRNMAPSTPAEVHFSATTETQWRELFEHSPVMYFMVDPAGTVLAVNAFGAGQLGYAVRELVGESVLKVFFPDDAQAARKNLERCVRTLGQPNTWEIRKVRKDGTLLWVRENAKAVRRADGDLIVLIACEDISSRKRGEQRLAAQYGVTRILAESDSLAAANPGLLRTICDAMEWDWAALWSVDVQTQRLRCDCVWHGSTLHSAEFDAGSRDIAWAPGEGRVGQVWQTGQPLWIADVTQDPGFRRRPAAARAALHTGVACPILIGQEVLGIIEFFSRRIREPDEQEVATLSGIGSQIGQFIRRKRAEQAVQASEKRFRALIEHAYDLVLLMSAEGTLLYASPSVERVLGYTPEELIGQNAYHLVHPDHREASVGRFTRVVGQPGAVVTGERLLLHKDGSTRWVENVIVNLLSEPSVQAIVMHQRDVTGRKRAEILTAQVFETAPDGICIVGKDYRYRRANPVYSRRWGMPAERMVGMHVSELLGVDAFEQTLKPYLDRCFAGEEVTFEWISQYRDWLYLAVSYSPLRLKLREVEAVLVVQRDLTEYMRASEALRVAQAELAHANRVATMGQLTASIAHEVNQPIAATVTNAQAALRWLGGRAPNLEEARQSLAQIAKDGNRAADVIARIRDLIRKAPPRKDRFDINRAIRDVLELTREETVKNDVAVRAELAEDLPLIEGDRVELQQVMLNLIINAVEAMGGLSEGPRELRINAGKSDSGEVLVAVRDSGPGLAPAALERLFEPFYTTKSTGLGLGLSICRSIVEAHGGQMGARANVPRGAIFQFTIPAP